MALLACEVLFGVERGGEVRALMVDLLGGPCPCVRAGVCPLLGREDDSGIGVLNTCEEPEAGAEPARYPGPWVPNPRHDLGSIAATG